MSEKGESDVGGNEVGQSTSHPHSGVDVEVVVESGPSWGTMSTGRQIGPVLIVFTGNDSNQSEPNAKLPRLNRSSARRGNPQAPSVHSNLSLDGRTG